MRVKVVAVMRRNVVVSFCDAYHQYTNKDWCMFNVTFYIFPTGVIKTSFQETFFFFSYVRFLIQVSPRDGVMLSSILIVWMILKVMCYRSECEEFTLSHAARLIWHSMADEHRLSIRPACREEGMTLIGQGNGDWHWLVPACLCGQEVICIMQTFTVCWGFVLGKTRPEYETLDLTLKMGINDVIFAYSF